MRRSSATIFVSALVKANISEERPKTSIQQPGALDLGGFVCYPRNAQTGEISDEPIVVPPVTNDEERSNEPDEFYDSVADLSGGSHSSDGLHPVTEIKGSNNRGLRSGKQQRRKHRRSRNKHKISPVNSPADEINAHSLEGLRLDRCSLGTSPIYSFGVTPFSPEYTVETHLAVNDSDIFVQELRGRFRVHQQPELSRTESICDRNLVLNPEEDVSARALCPFRWVMDEPNPARFPERLMVAKCSCQLSKPLFGQLARCVELKKKIAVLWRTGCNGDRHVYSEGYDEIAVACVPIDFAHSDGVTASNIDISGVLKKPY